MENRYEEYNSRTDGIPFVLSSHLHRSALLVSREANWHENLEIQLCNEGEGSVLLDGQRVGFARGETVVVNAGVIHHTGTEGELVYSCLIMDSAFCREAGINPSALRFEEHFADQRVCEHFAEICRVYAAKDAPCRVARLRLLALSLLILLREGHTISTVTGAADTAMHQNAKAAIRYIRAHASEHLSLEGIAQALYVNKYVLSRQFKAVVRQTVVGYLNGYRCQQAYAMLQNGATVAEAAHACGFANLSFFAKTFRRYIGTPPSACRKK
jgi:AraC-like DNA-binding protein